MNASDQARPGHTLPPLNLDQLAKLRSQHHPDCYACTQDDHRLAFELGKSNELVGRITPSVKLCSYPGVFHGGMISLLIDEAMTCCLMAHGTLAMTAELTLRYHHSVELDQEITIFTQITRSRPSLYHLESQLLQGENLKVTAKAKFMRKSQ